MFIKSPASLYHAGHLALTGQFAETNPANLEPADIRAPTATVLATVVCPRLELGWPTLFYFPGQFRHNSIL
jgi:hypothetical protein